MGCEVVNRVNKNGEIWDVWECDLCRYSFELPYVEPYIEPEYVYDSKGNEYEFTHCQCPICSRKLKYTGAKSMKMDAK